MIARHAQRDYSRSAGDRRAPANRLGLAIFDILPDDCATLDQPLTCLIWRSLVNIPSRNPANLLVEDEPDIPIMLHRIMRDLTGGYDIVTVNGGQEALAVMAERSCPLLITDHNMPGMTGTQLTQKVKQDYPTTKVIIITAYATPDVERTARTA